MQLNRYDTQLGDFITRSGSFEIQLNNFVVWPKDIAFQLGGFTTRPGSEGTQLGSYATWPEYKIFQLGDFITRQGYFIGLVIFSN